MACGPPFAFLLQLLQMLGVGLLVSTLIGVIGWLQVLGDGS